MNLSPQFLLLVDSSGFRNHPAEPLYPARQEMDFGFRRTERSFGGYTLLRQQDSLLSFLADHSTMERQYRKSLWKDLFRAYSAYFDEQERFISGITALRSTTGYPRNPEVIPNLEMIVGREKGTDKSRELRSLWDSRLSDLAERDVRLTDFQMLAFLYLERARHMLSAQEIEPARRLLERASARYPNDKKIAQLLRAISPGETTKLVEKAKRRTKEMNWLADNGEQYRGMWVALEEDRLLASAVDLKSLLISVEEAGQLEYPAFIQYVSSK